MSMSEAQTKTRHLGKGMKPRGSVNKGEPEDSQENDVSASEGNVANEESTTYEIYDQIGPDFSSTPTLENQPDPEAPKETSAEAVVAVTDRFEHFMAPPADAEEKVGDFQNLADLMRKSKEASAVDGVDLQFPGDITQPRPNPSPGMIAIPTPEEIEAIETGDRLPKLVVKDLPEGWDADLKPGKIVYSEPNTGPQANGDYGVLVMVPEQLVSGVLGQAELDGVSPSEWLTVRMGEMLEGWMFGR